ncbi:MAG: hypothetical protein WAN22_08745 [Solirubrobacteraceae bacterium]
MSPTLDPADVRAVLEVALDALRLARGGPAPGRSRDSSPAWSVAKRERIELPKSE